MKILLAPDSFKGSLTSTEICEILERELSRRFPDAEIVSLPLADGGEGTIDAFNGAKPGQIVYAKAADPWFNEICAPYLLYDNAASGIRTAVIESAKVCGFIPPVKNTEFSSAPGNSAPMQTTTYGLGLLIRDALKQGARKILIGLGGSCTNDGGCGMAAALGTNFYGIPDKSPMDAPPNCNIPFVPTGGTLSDIAYINNSRTIKLLGGARGLYEGRAVDIIGMCDVTNPLCGKNGAAYVFAPQKGASEKDVVLLDEGLKHLVSSIDNIEAVNTAGSSNKSALFSNSPADREIAPANRKAASTSCSIGRVLFPGVLSAKKLAALPGSGSAGGLGFGIRAFAGGRLQSGIDLMLDIIDFDRQLLNADLVITGEGHLDAQSFSGKAVSGICKRCRNMDVPVIIVCGNADKSAKTTVLEDSNILKVIETGYIDFQKMSKNKIRETAIENLKTALSGLSLDIN